MRNNILSSNRIMINDILIEMNQRHLLYHFLNTLKHLNNTNERFDWRNR